MCIPTPGEEVQHATGTVTDHKFPIAVHGNAAQPLLANPPCVAESVALKPHRVCIRRFYMLHYHQRDIALYVFRAQRKPESGKNFLLWDKD